MWTEAAALALAGLLATGAARAQAPLGETPGAPEEPETAAANGEGQEESDSPGSGERSPLFQATLSVGGAHDRLESAGTEAGDFEDDIYVAGADIAIGGRLSERTALALEYAPEFEQFADAGEEDSLHHLAGARLAHSLTPQWGVSLVGSFLDTDDPGRFLDDALLLLRRTPYRQVTGMAGIDYHGRDGGARLEAGRIDTRVEPASGPFALGLDQSDDIATLGVDRTIGPRSGLFASYSYVTTDARPLVEAPLDPPVDPVPGAGDDEPIQQVAAGWRFTPQEAISVLLSAGALDDGVERSWIGAAEIERRGKASAFRLRYDRTAATLGGQISGSSPASVAPSGAIVRGGLTQTATLGFALGVGRRFSWEQDLRAMRTELPGAAGADRVDSLAARGLFTVETVKALQVFLAVDWFEQEIPAIPRASRLRATLGLRFGLVGPPRTFDLLDEPAAPPRPGAAYQTGGLQ